MIAWIWGKLESRVQAAITERILLFNAALIRRGQILDKPEDLPKVS
jgi:hypothetical protein